MRRVGRLASSFKEGKSMEKTINIGDKSIRLNNNIGWALAYRSQFGRDIVPAIMPLFASALDIMSGIIRETGGTGEVTVKELAALADGDALIDAVIHLGGLELTDFINITWSLAKCADDSIPAPEEWVKQFEEFPVDIIAPTVFGMIYKGVISSKNRERLENLKTRIQPILTSTQSSSPESNEE